MKLKIVVDEKADKAELYTGWGFSCYVKGVLFDTGADGAGLLQNLDLLDIPLSKIKKVVISHDHWDHHGGLWELLRIKPDLPVYGCAGFSSDTIMKIKNSGGRWIPVSSPCEIVNGLFSTGELHALYNGEYKGEQGLVLKSKMGISLISGCAHPGIVNMADIVIKQIPSEKLNIILGGFHLFRQKDIEVVHIINELKGKGFTRIIPLHCSGDYARKVCRSENILTGSDITL